MTDKSKEGEEAFLSRWSRRKESNETDQQSSKTISKSDVLETTITDGSIQLDNEPQLTDAEKEAEELEMAENRAVAESVDLETLNYESDFQLFMKKGVPETLKNQAMRKLWTSNPILANVDGLNDYDENFADPALNTFKSIWKVGRGFLTDEDDREELERKQALEKEKELAEQDNPIDENSSEKETLNEQQDETSTSVNSNTPNHQGHSPTSNIRLTETEQPVKQHTEPQEIEAESEKPLVNEEPELKRVSIRKRILDS